MSEIIYPVVGQRVKHKKYGLGTVVNKEYKNGFRHRYTVNIGIKWDKSGPMGWAPDSSHPISELEVIS